jgi:hypothetical protein
LNGEIEALKRNNAIGKAFANIIEMHKGRCGHLQACYIDE